MFLISAEDPHVLVPSLGLLVVVEERELLESVRVDQCCVALRAQRDAPQGGPRAACPCSGMSVSS